jgi:uncharacterized protein YjiS (DUF1127 family)
MRIANLLTSHMARAARRRALAKRTERELRQLDPAQLADIGVDRGNLESIAWELAWRRIPDDTVANDRGNPPTGGARDHAA